MKKPVLRQRNERGVTIIAFALMIIVIIGFTGLAVDVGYLQLEKRKVQAAADAAAMGALREMELGNTDLDVAGKNDATLNGFTDGQNDTIVSITNPPTSGTYVNQASAVSATVTRVVPTFFMRAMGQNSVTVSATAVAKTSVIHGSVGGCIFVMNPSASPALWIHGTPTVSTACSILVNSNSSSAFSMVGTSTVGLGNGAEIGVVGPGTAGQGWSTNGGITNLATSQPESPVNVLAFTDPLAGVPTPTPAGKTIQSSSQLSISPAQTVTLNPGIYCGGLNLQGTVTFNSGTYIIAGGGITISSQARISDTGVGEMFYNTSSSSQAWGCSGSTAAGSFTFDGGASINLVGLTQPDGHGTVGMIFFDDRSIIGLSHQINGNSTSSFDGAIYFLNSALNFIGTNKTNGYLYLVSDTLSIGGNAGFGNDKSSLASVYTLAPTSTGGGLVQ